MFTVLTVILFACVAIRGATSSNERAVASAKLKSFIDVASKREVQQKDLDAGTLKEVTALLAANFERKTIELKKGQPDQGTLNSLQQRRFKSSGSTVEFRERQVLGCTVIATTTELLIQNKLIDPNKLPNKDECDFATRKLVNTKHSITPPFCPPYSTCPSNKYRTIDGVCNNLQNPNWGRAGRKFARWLNPIYSDDKNCTDARSGLPNAREVSKAVHETTSMESNDITHMVMQWGQFLDHDITHTPLTVADNQGSPLACECGTNNSNCHNIDLFPGDLLIDANGPCISFARSKPAAHCSCGCREQENSITAYIDASNVYGSEFQLSVALRSTDGRLEVQLASAINIPGTPATCHDSDTAKTCNQYLPNSTRLPVGYRPTNSDSESPNFLAGDVRVGEQPGLTGMHTIWLREHNLMVDYLENISDPGLNSNTKYLEARRFIGAIHQHITYNEYLPAILGSINMQNEGILPSSSVSFRSDYNSSCDATITNAFATAAYRFGHSLIRSLFSLILNGNFNNSNTMNLADRFEDPAFLISTFPKLDEILLGMSSDKAEKNERFITEAVRDRLFADDATVFGMDLAALNIQRGRDHGLPGWAAYRQKFNLNVPSSVNDPSFWKDAATADALASKYSNVTEIDLFVGMLAEKTKAGAIVGDLLYTMLVDQFKRLKDCDRYFYEHSGQEGSFTDEEMKMIKSQTLAKVLCRQLPSIQTIQPNVFLQTSHPGNGRVLCSELNNPPPSYSFNHTECIDNPCKSSEECLEGYECKPLIEIKSSQSGSISSESAPKYCVIPHSLCHCCCEMNLAIVFDQSGSMGDPNSDKYVKAKSVLQGLMESIARLNKYQFGHCLRVGIVSFATSANITLPLTSSGFSFSDITSAINNLPISVPVIGIGTDVAEGMRVAQDELLIDGRRNVMLVVTDHVSWVSIDQAKTTESIRGEGTCIHTVGISSHNPLTDYSALEMITGNPNTVWHQSTGNDSIIDVADLRDSLCNNCTDCCICPVGWKESMGQCYKVLDVFGHWYSGKKACAKLGATLVSNSATVLKLAGSNVWVNDAYSPLEFNGFEYCATHSASVPCKETKQIVCVKPCHGIYPVPPVLEALLKVAPPQEFSKSGGVKHQKKSI